LRDTLASSLYENHLCGDIPICRHSVPRDLEKELRCSVPPVLPDLKHNL
jgi:hypothetical protein